MRSRTTLVLLCLVSCSSSESPGPDGGSPPPEDKPITERTSQGTYQCTQERGRTDHRPRSWGLVTPALVKTSQGVHLARIESSGSEPFMQSAPELMVSSFDVAGTFGAPSKLPLVTPQEAGALAAAPRGAGYALVWVDGTKLRFAAFDGGGQNLVPARDIADGLDTGAAPMLAAGPGGGFGLIYAPPTAGNSREVRFAVLDEMGGVRLAPRPLTAHSGTTFTHPAPAITASGSGYAMAWRDPDSATGGIDFASTDAAGAEVVARHRISAPPAAGVIVGGLTGFESPTTALLATGTGFLAAWTETQRGTGDAGASSVVRVVRLDGAGVRQGPGAIMRAPAKDIDEVEPTLVPFGGAVAVLWGRGSHIYICGGCVPDHSIDLVLIDPTTLNPVSNVLSLSNGGDPRGGGLLRRRVAVLGPTLLATYLLTFHVHATPGSAAFRCETTMP